MNGCKTKSLFILLRGATSPCTGADLPRYFRGYFDTSSGGVNLRNSVELFRVLLPTGNGVWFLGGELVVNGFSICIGVFSP